MSNRRWDSRCGRGRSARRRGIARLRRRTCPGAAELVAAKFDTVAAVTDGCDEPVATGMMPKGVL